MDIKEVFERAIRPDGRGIAPSCACREEVICIIQGHGFVNREVVLYYFAGMCERFMMEGEF